jgi:hypothetical protein
LTFAGAARYCEIPSEAILDKVEPVDQPVALMDCESMTRTPAEIFRMTPAQEVTFGLLPMEWLYSAKRLT